MIEGVSVRELQATYGTPLYIMSEPELERRLDLVRNAFLDKYPNTYALYASKAMSIAAVYDKVMAAGLSIDVVSRGEMFVALHAGVPADRIHVHGSNKTVQDITFALENGITHFTIDNMREIGLLSGLAAEQGVDVDVLLRIVPQVVGGAHEAIQTGGVDTKFGFPTHDDTYLEAIKATLQAERLQLRGIHCHVGSQIQEPTLFINTVKTMVNFIETIRQETGYTADVLNIGGGFGVAYLESDDPLDFADTMTQVMDTLVAEVERFGLPLPKIGIEPGRWLVANAGATLYEVGTVKEVSGVRTYVSVDGGMTDNIRPALYDAEYDVIAATRMDEAKTLEAKIVGACCESGDIISNRSLIPPVEAGDLLLVKATGAYNFSMASNYNQMLRPAVVFVKDGTHRLVVRRQTLEDLVACEIVGQST
ncbi:MAG: diaminopimelate decarboxylase [Exiguobacterium chiriqhucha]|jgi:diaminopimelate decarboxylase|nr:MAG: diaminopimelate decarboxylase [Exiguobacterium chiriqhucha]TCI67068.1 diaminopimelate decarboxylase [Exiguobacterium sp. IPCI3]TCI76399.1 diaminopimelate decarboxylase [Exiguobacterium sp. IPCH1]TCI78176.1 diaminopimelate decarboxylase [Exiguobacterium sp. IPBC4]